MSDISLSSYGRLNDTLERDLMQRTLGNGESISFVAMLKTVKTTLSSVISRVADYVIELTEALNEARARDARFSGSQW